mmetsp:Transcript_40415/g.108477  ORF Transcript_40415/g.108477 Transcript_40415/m.108477 type:complete len:282 (-) Transcript_40415:262-1107(-)
MVNVQTGKFDEGERSVEKLMGAYNSSSHRALKLLEVGTLHVVTMISCNLIINKQDDDHIHSTVMPKSKRKNNNRKLSPRKNSPEQSDRLGDKSFPARVVCPDATACKVLNLNKVPKLLTLTEGPCKEPEMAHISPMPMQPMGVECTQPTASDAFAVNLNSPQNDTPQPQPFRREVSAAARWWASQLQGSGISKTNLKTFEDTVATLLAHRCDGHWYPSDPSRASGLRSTMNDVTVDPILVAAAEAASIADIGRRLPLAVVWVNPGSVRARVEGAVPAFDVA